MWLYYPRKEAMDMGPFLSLKNNPGIKDYVYKLNEQKLIAIGIIFLCLTLLICWVIFSPIRIHVDTWSNGYSIKWLWILKFEVVPTDDFVIFRISHPFGIKSIDPLKQKSSKQLPSEKSTVENSGGSARFRKVRKVFLTAIRFIRSFRTEEFLVVYPASDFVRAAQLQPVFQLLRSLGLTIHTSYTGDEGLRFDGYNRVSNLLYHGFRVFALNK